MSTPEEAFGSSSLLGRKSAEGKVTITTDQLHKTEASGSVGFGALKIVDTETFHNQSPKIKNRTDEYRKKDP